MKAFDIYDEERGCSVGTLLSYEKEKSFVIELTTDLDEWTAPLLFTSYVKKNIYTIPRDISLLWVRGRIVPPDRQNIGSILTNHHLKSYDEGKLLEISEGRCVQDALCVKPLEELPDYVLLRQKQNCKNCFVTTDSRIVVFFEDGKTKIVELPSLADADLAEKLTAHPALLRSAKIGPGGYCITFNDSIDIAAHALYHIGNEVPLSLADFLEFSNRNLLDTTEACNLLGCSRQNISYLVKEDYLTPVRENVRGNLYLKDDLMKYMIE